MIRPAVLASLLVVGTYSLSASPLQQADSTQLGPDDFARGVEITPPPGPFFRIDLPEYVFAGAAWSDLRDLRVFNRAGESVPFARVTPPRADGETRRVPLRSFRLESMAPGGVPQIELDARSRTVELRVSPARPEQPGVEYVLAVSQPDLSTPIHRLLFEWSDRGTSWRQIVNVSVSSDLDSWRMVAIARPLMDLKTADGSRLLHAEVSVEPQSPASSRYWRLQFGPGEAPILTNVDGETRAAVPDLPGVPIRTAAPVGQDGAAVYQLASPQPVSRLRITPQDANSVLPLLVEAKEEDASPWVALTRTVAYRMNAAGAEQFSDPIVLGGRLVKAIRLRPLGTSWGSAMPQLDVERDPLALVVNARGAGPFLLAWGSRAATDSAIPFGQLVPNWTSERPFEIPVAEQSGLRELGGDSRLTAMAPAERAARWQTMLVWLVLVGGAGALALLAFRVWREARVTQDQA